MEDSPAAAQSQLELGGAGRDRPCCHEDQEAILPNQDPAYEQNLALISPMPGGREGGTGLSGCRFCYKEMTRHIVKLA